MRALWIGVGFGAGLFPVVAYFGLLGLLPRFCLAFTIGQRYINFRSAVSVGPQYWLLYPFLGLALNNAAFLTFGLAGLVMMLISKLPKYHSQRSEESSMAFYVAVWYILSFVEAGISRVFFLHYYLLIVPPLALLAAWLLLKVYRDVKNQVRAANRFAVLFLTVLLAIALFISVRQNFDYYYHYARYKLGLETYQDFLLNGWPNEGLHLVRVQELADYVKGHTSPVDYIYYWSGDVQIYYLADRRCPIDIIWPLYAEATGPYQRIFAPQTKYVIVGESNNIPRPDWLYTELAKKYTLETVIRVQEVYRRID